VSAPERSGFLRSSEETLFAWRAWRLVRGSFVAPDGETFERSFVRSPGAVAVVAVSAGHVALIRQYRPALDRVIWEIPAGMRDQEGEDVVVAAQRELSEETGASGGRWRELATIVQAPGLTDAGMTIFLADDVVRGEPRPEGPEERAMTLHWVPCAEAVAMVDDGRIVNSTAVVGLLSAQRRGWR
jgi:8-oxo-dGTP pyrophosphatase MutT (NUDIX family)